MILDDFSNISVFITSEYVCLNLKNIVYKYIIKCFSINKFNAYNYLFTELDELSDPPKNIFFWVKKILE